MNTERKRHEPIHLKEEELRRLPEKIGNVTLNYKCYSGADLYSDGDIEEELLSIVKNASRVEYPAIIEEKNSWPILYHLSALRGNIVDWLPIGKQDRVLEVGAGCGAITQQLARKAKSVTCVELSARRSYINAYRNHDRDNIEIHVGNFSDIEPSLSADYDMICMIGVFEYGQSYIHTRTPYEDFLKIMMKHLKEGGRIVIAIENQFGLKYWAGCMEDHIESYFSSLEGYPEGGSARTFTRAGLEKIFKNCGVKEYAFYYPYPDYKFSTAVYSDRRLPKPGELTDNIRNFDHHRMLLFNEKYVYDSVIRDGMFDIFSNSYLAVIGKETDTCYVKYSNDRSSDYALRTEILDVPESGKRIVRKIPLTEEAKAHVYKMKRSCELLKERYRGSGLFINECTLDEEKGYAEFPYETGVTLEELLDQCLAVDDMEGFYRLFDRYYELISWNAEYPVVDQDLIFANILVDGDRWTVIDYEWTAERVISPAEIAFRAVYCYVLEEEKRNKLDLDRILARLGISQQTAEEYREREGKFQKQVTGKHKSMGEIRAGMGTCCVDMKGLLDQYLEKILERRIQVYYDRGNGFREDDSCYLPDVYVEESKIEAEIQLNGNVKAVRIDPADRSCMVRLSEIYLNNNPVPFQKKYIETNGKTIKSGCYVFDTQDPNILIKVSELPMNGENTLSVRMELTPVSEEMARDMMGAVKKLF